MHTFSSRTVKTRNNRTALHFSCNLANYILGLEFGDHAKFQDQLKYKGLLKKRVQVYMKVLLRLKKSNNS